MSISKYYALLVKPLLAALCILSLTACSSTTPIKTTAAYRALADPAFLEQQLYRQYNEWKGVKYKLGGLSKQGIDCSGFVFETFRSKFNVSIPRTTELQSKYGVKVARTAVQMGDLIFFKTDRKVRHVGIYLEDGKFLHASTSKGVTISNLSNQYWKDRYWQTRRVAL